MSVTGNISNAALGGGEAFNGVWASDFYITNPYTNPAAPSAALSAVAGVVTAGDHQIALIHHTVSGTVKSAITTVTADGTHKIDVTIPAFPGGIVSFDVVMTIAGGSFYWYVVAESVTPSSTYAINITDANLILNDPVVITSTQSGDFINTAGGNLYVEGVIHRDDDQLLQFGTSADETGRMWMYWDPILHALTLFDEFNGPDVIIKTDQAGLEFAAYGADTGGRLVRFDLSSNYRKGTATALALSIDAMDGESGHGIDAASLTGHVFRLDGATVYTYGALSTHNFSNMLFNGGTMSLKKFVSTVPAINAAGANYAPGDSVRINGTSANLYLTVATVGGGGAITSFTLVAGGYFEANNAAAPVITLTGIGAGATVVIDITSGTLDYVTTAYFGPSTVAAPMTATYQLAAYFAGDVKMDTDLYLPGLPASDPAIVGQAYTFSSSSGVGATVLADLAAALTNGQKIVLISNG